MIIFGAAVRPDGRPSDALQARIAAALVTGRRLGDPLYMPTGGQGRHGPPEADVMADVLMQHGVSPDAIIRERTGVNTLRSALACAELLGQTDAPTFVATSRYHMLRCIILLRLAGVRAYAGSMPDGPASRYWRKRWFWRLRETLAIPVDSVLLSVMRLKQRRGM